MLRRLRIACAVLFALGGLVQLNLAGAPILGNQRIELASIQHERGLAYWAPLPNARWSSERRPSPAVIEEDGVALQPGNALHDQIRSQGGGAFSFWGDRVYFSSSDGSVALRNGHHYVARGPRLVPEALVVPSLAALVLSLLALAVTWDWRRLLAPADTARSRLDYLDALRGWAILGVLLVHSGNALNPSAYYTASRDGARGVQLFYTLSALTLFLTRRDEPHATRNFFIRRFFRIAPMFYVTVALYTMQSWLWNFGAPLEHQMPLARVLSLVTFTHGFSPTWMNGLFGEWSIAIEVLFYALVPLLYVLVTSLRRAGALVAGGVLAGWLITVWATAHPPIADADAWLEYLALWFPNQWSSFAFGIVIFHLLRRAPERVPPGALLALGLALIAAATLAGGWGPLPHHQLFELGFVPLIVSLHRARNRVLVNPITCWLGRISYSFYLLHLGFIVHIHPRILGLSDTPGGRFVLTFVLGGAGAAAISAFTFALVEKPGIAFGKRLIERLSGAPAVERAA